MKKLGKTKPDFKPDSVKIASHLSMVAVQNPTEPGKVILFVTALGDDQRVYSWEGSFKKWVVQG